METKPTDEELCDKNIAKLMKLYKIDSPLPKHIRDDIMRACKNIGICCSFADWINHRIYCWALEVDNRGRPGFIHWEYISSGEEESEEEESEEEDDGILRRDRLRPCEK